MNFGAIAGITIYSRGICGDIVTFIHSVLYRCCSLCGTCCYSVSMDPDSKRYSECSARALLECVHVRTYTVACARTHAQYILSFMMCDFIINKSHFMNSKHLSHIG